MPRPCIKRKVFGNPTSYYFKPSGIRKIDLDESVLLIEEVEAIRLIDFEGIEQIKAAKQMKISQPTFSRILKQGRKKIADAIVTGKAIKITKNT